MKEYTARAFVQERNELLKSIGKEYLESGLDSSVSLEKYMWLLKSKETEVREKSLASNRKAELRYSTVAAEVLRQIRETHSFWMSEPESLIKLFA